MAIQDARKRYEIQVSMGGKGQWTDNVFIERLWQSLKYECVDLNAFQRLHERQRQRRT